MTLYNALPCKEYERVIMCKTAKEVWHTLIITHQGNSQVKNFKIDLLTREYEKFLISHEETIDSGFTRFNAIVSSLKFLDPDYSSKNHVRKFLCNLPMKWRAKVIAIEEAKDLATLPFDELMGNLKVYEMVLASDGVASKPIKEKVMPIALKSNVIKGQTSNDSLFKKGNRFERENCFGNGGDRFDRGHGNRNKVVGSSRGKRNCYGCGSKNHFIDDYPKVKMKKAFFGGAWSDSKDGDQMGKDATCLMVISSQKIMYSVDGGGGTDVRVGRGGKGRRPREGNDESVDELNGQGNDQGLGANRGNLLPAMLAQVSNRGNVGNQNGNVVNENVQENMGNVLVNGNRVGCSYKEFLACNPKEYDGKGGVVVLTRWIEKMESVQDMSSCSNDQKVKYTAGSFVGKALMWWNSQIRTLSQEVAVSMSWNDFKFMMIQEFCPSHEMQKLESELWNHAMVGAGHAAYTDRFHELARLVPYLVTPESRMIERYVYGLTPQIRGMVAATEPKTMQKAVQISGALTDEAVRNGSIKKVEKRGNVGEPSKDRSRMDDNKRTRTVNAFATTVNPVGRENMGTWSKCTTYNSYHAPGGPCRTCFNCNRPGHLAKDYRGVLRNMNPVNARNP
ncbi:reverse transcriptase domain-containing protein, partial [Tanacetum coccineum]